MSGRDESVLARWSRRKHEARESANPAASGQISPPGEALDTDPVSEAAAGGGGTQARPPAPAAPAAAAESGDALPTPEELPDVETLSYESDFTVFLREGVPDLVRRQALRKLWSSAPILANLDGLNDYDPDRSTFLTVLEEGAQTLAGAARGMKLPELSGAAVGADAAVPPVPATAAGEHDEAAVAVPATPEAVLPQEQATRAGDDAADDHANDEDTDGQASAPEERT